MPKLWRAQYKLPTDLGGVDILVHNLGVRNKVGPLDSIDADMFIASMHTNLTALIQLTRHILPVQRTRGAAAILNVESKSGTVVSSGQTLYLATN